MARDEDPDRPAPKPRHALGEPLDALSVDELGAGSARRRAEIAGLDAAGEAKLASRDAADAFFKR